ncbi:MAG: hypothetical protein JOZ75_01220 [Candidatus Dormibacteraeota bacterium]|nr:hypothetical protein [Candidatus Dormibacteraeota bacterium]
MSGALSLALTPAPLIIALGIAAAGGGRHRVWTRWPAMAGLLATVALLSLDAVPVVGGGRILASFGQAMPGIPYLFRADSVSVTVALAAAVAALLALVGPRVLDPRQSMSLVLCVLGSVVAAVAGNAVMLFAGVELANIGTFLLLTPHGRRPGRGAVAALALEHLGALGLLAAAADLQGSVGTSDFSALPGGAVTPAVAVPWALGAAVRLLAPAMVPLRTTVTTAAWAATAAVPTGAVMLLRLREASGGVEPVAASVTLVLAGLAIAAGGAALLAWRSTSASRAGRGLCLAVAGPVIALAGLPEAIAATAVAAGIAALEIAVASSVLWERSDTEQTERGLAAAALIAAGGLPLGFGATAIVLELTAAMGLGAVGLPLVLGLGFAVLATVAGSVRLAGVVLRRGGPAERGSGWPPLLGVVALTASVAGAVIPGALAGWINAAIGSPGTLADAGAAAVSGPAGGWPGGYFVVAAVVLGAGCLAALSLSGARLRAPEALLAPRDGAPAHSRPQPTVAVALPLRMARRIRGPRRALSDIVPWLDGWIAQQPQLPLIAAGGLLAVLLIR